MANEIISTADIAESEWDGHSEPSGVETDMVATKAAGGKGIEFHVSMRDYTQRDMDALVVEAAARVLVGERGNNKLAKMVEERCIALTTEKVDQHLAGVTAGIIEQPIIPKFPFVKADEKPVTIREFIGLTGQAYLTAKVDSSGKPTTDNYYSKTRMQHLVDSYMASAFKREIETATNAVIVEIQNRIRADHKALLEVEKARFRAALAKVGM
jgi:hypothetical protein